MEELENGFPDLVITKKLCARCHLQKPSDDFYISKRSKDGLRSYCKSCDLSAIKRHRQEVAELDRIRLEELRKEWGEER